MGGDIPNSSPPRVETLLEESELKEIVKRGYQTNPEGTNSLCIATLRNEKVMHVSSLLKEAVRHLSLEGRPGQDVVTPVIDPGWYFRRHGRRGWWAADRR